MQIRYSGMPMRFAHTGVTQFAPENTLLVYMMIVGGLAIADGIVRVIRAYNIRHRWYSK